MEKKQKQMKPNVALPCLLKEEYAPQNPSATLYDGKETSVLTVIGVN